jgi:class 3 adenylate cyclase/CHASE2 domain-containing sensor protein
MSRLAPLWQRLTAKKPHETALIHHLAGFGIGLLMITFVILLKVTPGLSGFYNTIELKALDLRFKLRPKIEEHPRIVNIDIDDASLKNLDLVFPFPRTEYAYLISTLHRLGAERIMMDVYFTQPADNTTSKMADGRLRVSNHDDNLATAIAYSGNVYLAWAFQEDPMPDEEHKDLYDRMKQEFIRDLTIDSARIAAALGVPETLFTGGIESIRRRALKEHLVDQIRKRPPEAGELTPDEVLRACVPGYNPERHASETTLVLNSIEKAYSVAAIERHSSWPCTDEAAHPKHVIREIVAPVRSFNGGIMRDGRHISGATGAGFVNNFFDTDGIIRHMIPINVWRGRAYYHLSFRTLCDALGVTPDRITVEPGHAIRIRPNTSAFPDLPDSMEIPLNEKNELLINWAGSGNPTELPFKHVPIGALVELDKKTQNIGINAAAAFAPLWDLVQQLGELIPEDLRTVPDALQALLQAETESTQGKDPIDTYVQTERHRRMRDHAAWMIERSVKWREAIAAWMKQAIAQNEIDQATADQVQAVLNDNDAVIRNYVLPEIEREKYFLDDIQPKIKGADCIIGYAGTSLDLHPTPIYSAFSGAHALSNYLNMFYTNNFLFDTSRNTNLIAILLWGIAISLLVTRAGPVASTVGTLVAELAWGTFAQVLFWKAHRLIDVTGPVLVIFLSYAFITAYRQLIEGRDKRQVRKMFGLFVSDQVLAELMKNPNTLSLGGQKRVATIFFSDVSGFTALSEKMDPADQIRFMNVYLTAMSDVIMKHNGYLDKYIGDGIMAVFGAPLSNETHAVDAARTAIECLGELKKLNEILTAENKPNIKIRIGISTGEVVTGLVGSMKKLSYTAMGDFVNLGARLEAASKQYKTKIIINDNCHARCKDEVIARELDLIRVPGKSIPVQVFELLGLKGDPAYGSDGLLPLYNAGLQLYKNRKWAESASCFEQCLALLPDDGPAKIYHERATLFMDVPPGDDWDGVAVVSVK